MDLHVGFSLKQLLTAREGARYHLGFVNMFLMNSEFVLLVDDHPAVVALPLNLFVTGNQVSLQKFRTREDLGTDLTLETLVAVIGFGVIQQKGSAVEILVTKLAFEARVVRFHMLDQGNFEAKCRRA